MSKQAPHGRHKLLWHYYLKLKHDRAFQNDSEYVSAT